MKLLWLILVEICIIVFSVCYGSQMLLNAYVYK